MRRGGSGSLADAGAESGGGLTGAGASGLAVAIDAVRVGAASSTNADTGPKQAPGSQAPEHRDWPSQSIRFASEPRPRKRLGPEAVVDEDARGKRREERYGHDERRFHGHGQTVSSILPKES